MKDNDCIVRCQQCNKEIKKSPLTSHKSCGCANMMVTVNEDDSVTAVDLNRVIMVRSNEE